MNTLNAVAKVARLGSKNGGRYARSIWLFTRSDLKTILVPSTVFGVSTTLALALSEGRSEPERSIGEVVARLPLACYWVWINLLPFNIDNQRDPKAIAEDGVNKPWRPLPSGSISQIEAKMIMLFGYTSAVFSSYLAGGMAQCVTLILLGFWYNDLGGADSSWLVRNLINGGGYIAFTSGAFEVVSRQPILRSAQACYSQWVFLVGALVTSTVHLQDMYDQEGDAARKRETLPLRYGDHRARVIAALLVPFWSLVCPVFWAMSTAAAAPYLALGALIAWRTLNRRTVSQDKTTFRLWNLWIATIYLLPLLSATSELDVGQGLSSVLT